MFDDEQRAIVEAFLDSLEKSDEASVQAEERQPVDREAA
jgi:hypothetical protein